MLLQFLHDATPFRIRRSWSALFHPHRRRKLKTRFDAPREGFQKKSSDLWVRSVRMRETRLARYVSP